MAKKEKNKFKESTIQNYYDLKVDKVDELVAALQDEGATFEDDVNYAINASTGVYDEKNVKRNGKEREFDPYKVDKFSRIPTWIKACFIKWWFAGVVCYFIIWGLSIGDGLDRIVFTGVVLGLIVDMFVNPIFRYMESDRKEYNAYMMFPFPFKAFWTFFANIFYYLIVVALVAALYSQINILANLIYGTTDKTYLGVESLLFGTFCVIVDMIFIGIKDGVVALVRHLKKSKKENAVNV